MISLPLPSMVNAVAESKLNTITEGKRVPGHGLTVNVATAIIGVEIVVTPALGPWKRGSHFQKAIVGDDVIAMNEAKVVDVGRGRSFAALEKAGDGKVEAVRPVERKRSLVRSAKVMVIRDDMANDLGRAECNSAHNSRISKERRRDRCSV
ncbi:hypothetical protein DOTSEDRAFT_29019 [Dothistroma septosporum NZE10]|uniref:Uncharacterized protein n=1 Tax=Dothistroma septosporum (strain NZE10 / CBS 128990) TaxID=675120 RepID=M2YIW2_DOTSN|nr:hypothetical protein DOTSEDRAFT_29019 [Dothistroma septosporum NZE10]